MNKQDVIDRIIDLEGGYVNDPADSGGETNFGITVKVARKNGYNGPMASMPRRIAEEIYGARYWDAVRADNLLELSEIIAEEVVDTAVNMGVKRAGIFLQKCLNVLNSAETRYDDVKVDGKIGPATLRALGEYLDTRDGLVLLTALNCLQGAHYVMLAEKRKKDERFVYGWFKNRVQL